MTYFFVGGSQRSGTSLLQAILSADAETNPRLYEASYFKVLVATYQFGKATLNGKAAHYFADLEELRHFSASWARSFLEMTLQRYAPARHLVLKEPHLTMLFPDIAELISDAKFLVIVRDPRDVIASMLEVEEKLVRQGQSAFPRRDMAALSNHYKSFYAPVMNCQSEDFKRRTCFVKYEKLVYEPEAELEKIRTFTGLKLEGFDASADWEPGVSAPRPESQPWRTRLHDRGVSADSVGRYRSSLRPDEIAQIEKECGDAFQLFHYEVDQALTRAASAS